MAPLSLSAISFLLSAKLLYLIPVLSFIRVVSTASQETPICKIIISKGSHETIINEGVIISSEDLNDTVAILHTAYPVQTLDHDGL